MKIKTLAIAVAALAISTSGALAQYTTIWSDNFDGYADQAAMDAVYTQIYPSFPMLLDTTKGASPAQSIHGGSDLVNYHERMYLNLPGGPISGSDANPLMVQFKVDTDEVLWYTRQYIELRSYSGGAYGSGALQELCALGFTSSGVDTTLVNQRIAFTGAGWGNLTSTYATRASVAYPGNEFATTLAMAIKSSTVDYYVNGHLDSTQTIGSGILFDSLVIGSGLSSQVDVWFDDISVTVGIPEPSTFALGLVGGLGLLCMFRRRSA